MQDAQRLYPLPAAFPSSLVHAQPPLARLQYLDWRPLHVSSSIRLANSPVRLPNPGKRCHGGQKILLPLSDRLRKIEMERICITGQKRQYSTDHIPHYPDRCPSRHYSVMAASPEQFLPFVSLPLRRVYPLAMLTNTLYLPYHTDPTRAHLLSLIAMDQLLETW